MELPFFSVTPAIIKKGTFDQLTAQRIVALVSRN